MVPFHLQIELTGRWTTLMVEQMDRLTDDQGFMRYQVRTFNQHSMVFVNIEGDLLSPESQMGFSEDDAFKPQEIEVTSAAIRDYNSTGKRNADQIAFDF